MKNSEWVKVSPVSHTSGPYRPKQGYSFPLISVIFSMLMLLSMMSAEVWAASNPLQSGEALIKALRQGGYNLYFRHEATNWTQYDVVNRVDDWLSCDGNRIRQLSSVGRERAQATGEAIRTLNIPIGKVWASPYCRTLETARQMNLGEVSATNEVINLRVAEFFGGRAAVVATAQALLARVPGTKTNTVIVAHGNVAQAATPVYPGEGEGIVFQPDGEGGFRFIGRLSPDDWLRLNKQL